MRYISMNVPLWYISKLLLYHSVKIKLQKPTEYYFKNDVTVWYLISGVEIVGSGGSMMN